MTATLSFHLAKGFFSLRIGIAQSTPPTHPRMYCLNTRTNFIFALSDLVSKGKYLRVSLRNSSFKIEHELCLFWREYKLNKLI